jgi:hypothetical protein
LIAAEKSDHASIWKRQPELPAQALREIIETTSGVV